jgi:hypothetical protein
MRGTGNDQLGTGGKMATNERGGLWSRRDFFTRVGWAGFGLVSFMGLLGFIRSAFPRVLFQPPATFKAGFPSDYALGEVSEKFKKTKGFGSSARMKGSTASSPSARTWAARHAGSQRKTSLNVRAMAAAFISPD